MLKFDTTSIRSFLLAEVYKNMLIVTPHAITNLYEEVSELALKNISKLMLYTILQQWIVDPSKLQ